MPQFHGNMWKIRHNSTPPAGARDGPTGFGRRIASFCLRSP